MTDFSGYTKAIGGIHRPNLNPDIHYPDDEIDTNLRDIPDIFRNDVHTLEAYINSKAEVERLRMSAYYNKLFPSLEQTRSYTGAAYHSIPFTAMEQEVNDAGLGLSKNYLKACVDTIVARLKNITFTLKIEASTPLLLLEMYKTQIERHFKGYIEQNKLTDLATYVFHDAAILNHSHALLDPWTRKTRKVNDWEVGVYECEFDNYDVKRCLIRDKQFPVSSLGPYTEGFDLNEIARICHNRDNIPLYLYFDCFVQKKMVMIDHLVGPVTSYPFETVLLETFDWDIGVKRSMTTCLFELLFPLQRVINALTAKLTTNYMNYKGVMPVISTLGDVEAVKTQLTNRSGEVLIINGASADVTKMVGQIDIVPLDSNASALIESIKANMLEIAGVQEISLDLSNLRSAAAVVAVAKMSEQEPRFASQMYRTAVFLKNILLNEVRFNASLKDDPAEIPWDQLLELSNASYIDMIPVHNTDMEDKPSESPENFVIYAADHFILDVINGKKSFHDLDYTINRQVLKIQAVNMLLRFKALGGDFENLETLCVHLFIDDVRHGNVRLTEPLIRESDVEVQPPSAGGPSVAESPDAGMSLSMEGGADPMAAAADAGAPPGGAPQ